MKNIIALLIYVFCFVLGQADHIIFTEVVLQPSDGEYVEITNPTEESINLSNYYITDATNPAANKFYYNLPTNENFWSGSNSDFICKFPENYALGAGSSVKISLRSDERYQNTYGELPGLALDGDMLSVLTEQNTKGSTALAKLSNSSETLILFYWDGISSVVKDVD